MKIGIMVYSNTGNTLSVAQRLKERLIMEGHLVNLVKVEAVGKTVSSFENVQLKNAPEIDEYEALIFAAPVQGNALSPVMYKYLSQLETLKGKLIAGFVTQAFPFESMGGTSAIKQMKEICEIKGGSTCETGIINWLNINRERKIKDTLDKLARAIPSFGE